MIRASIESFVLRRGIKDTISEHGKLIGLNSDGPWLVGGSVRRFLQGEEQDSDLDVAFKNEGQVQETANRLLSSGWKKDRENEKYIQFKDESGKVIQLLRLNYFGTPEEAIDAFDFTICMAAYDGHDIVLGDLTLYDLGRKRLVLHRLTYGTATISRLVKYARQGYTYCSGTITNILNAVVDNPGLIRGDVTYVD